jgi:hypothetical protein
VTDNGGRPENKKIKFHVTINVYEDNTTSVDAPKDFLLFRDMCNAAERILIDQIVQQRVHEQQRRILQPTLKGVIPLQGKN